MPLDFRNLNTLWASVLVETLSCLGLKTAIICPGSRSAPLAIAFAQHANIETLSILDERSAAFFALGLSKQTGIPVVLVCTSGTAGANFYPAVIEAKESRVPLLVLSADRPPELRHCHAGQTIEQVHLFGHYPNWQIELSLPDRDPAILGYLRQTISQAYNRCHFPTSGPVHVNIPLRDPLAPTSENALLSQEREWSEDDFFAAVKAHASDANPMMSVPESWQTGKRGLIVAGVTSPRYPKQYALAVAELSHQLAYPVLAEALSPLRNYQGLCPNLIATYDLILRNQTLAETLRPEIVIQLGELPTSKELRSWLSQWNAERWVIDPSGENLDPLHGKTRYLHTSVESLMRHNQQRSPAIDNQNASTYYHRWHQIQQQVHQRIQTTMRSIDWLLEAKASWLLSQLLPPQIHLFIANSMPVRTMEWFWMPNNQQILPLFNRGANGIDGTLSSALGGTYGHTGVLLTGDLALLHDTNGFLVRQQFKGHLTIILINNQGGGIFEMLPIADFDPPFEQYFATPQNIDFAKLCRTYDVEYEKVSSWNQFEQSIQSLGNYKSGIRLLELATNRKANSAWLKQQLPLFSANIV